MPATPETSTPRPIAEKRLDVAARACLLLAGAAVVGGIFGYVLVWGQLVVRGWVASTAFLLAALAIAVARASIRRRLDQESEDAPKRRSSRWWSVLVFLSIAGTVSLGCGDWVVGARYTVLNPSAPGFCKGLVREDSFLLAGGGELHAVGLGGIARPVGSWTADDGYRAVAAGDYEFTSTATEAVFRVYGNGIDPVWPALHGFDCR